MSTDKPKVSAYVPQIIKDRLIQFRDEYRLSSESEALTTILAQYFGIEGTTIKSTEKSTVGGVTLAEFEDMKAKIASLLERVDYLESTSRLPELKQEQEVSSQLILLEPTVEFQPVSGHKLSARFGLNKDTAAGKKRKLSTEEFTRWTKEQDPDKIAWYFTESPVKGYLPESGLPDDLRSRLLQWYRENDL